MGANSKLILVTGDPICDSCHRRRGTRFPECGPARSLAVFERRVPLPATEAERRPIRGFIPDARQKQDGQEAVEGYVDRLKRVGYRVVFGKAATRKRRPKGRGRHR